MIEHYVFSKNWNKTYSCYKAEILPQEDFSGFVKIRILEVYLSNFDSLKVDNIININRSSLYTSKEEIIKVLFTEKE